MEVFMGLLVCLLTAFISAMSGWLLGKILNDLDTQENDSRYQSYCASCGFVVCTTAIAFWMYGQIGFWALCAIPVIVPLSRWIFAVCTPKQWYDGKAHFATSVDTDLQWLCAICGGVGSFALAGCLMHNLGVTGAILALALSCFMAIIAGGAVMFVMATVVSICSHGIPRLAGKLTDIGGKISEAVGRPRD